jgi:hypothetical protein
MSNMEKSLNKRLIGLILWTTLLSVNTWSQTPKGKKFFTKVIDFFRQGIKEMKKNMK